MPQADTTTPQRSALFQSTYTVNGKTSPSFVFAHMVQRGNSIIVDHRVLGNLSIGLSCSNSVWCDIVPINACHVLLGRHWQYDRGVLHDGKLNTYSSLFNGIKIVLHPHAPISPPITQTEAKWSS